MSYQGRAGHYWEDKGSIISKGEYTLRDDYPVDFGEPVCLIGTGTVPLPFRKRQIKSYDATAGAEATIGVSLEWRRATSGWTHDELALYGPQDLKRDLSVMLLGGCSIKNMGTGVIDVQRTVIPANGGCAIMTNSNQYSLGKSMQYIPTGARGIIWVSPDYEKPITDAPGPIP
jgi:hypothetical protein